MRIVAGRHRGRTLVAPEGLAVRPTADRTREALFGILTQGKLGAGQDLIEGARVLDAFAGSGALGLEALSRGAAQVTFLENHAAALAALERNIAALGAAAQCRVLAADALRPPRARADGACAIVLMDPPYNLGLAAPTLVALRDAGWLASGAIVTVELMKTEDFAAPEGFEVVDERKYGKAKVVFLRRNASA